VNAQRSGIRIYEQCNRGRFRHDLVQQLGPLCFHRSDKKVDACGVPAGPIEAGDKTQADRVIRTHEHDRYCGGRRLSHLHRRRIHDNDGPLATNQIGCQSRQLVIVVLSPPVFDPDVLTFEEARFLEALLECRAGRRGEFGRSGWRNPMTGIIGCCARAAGGDAAAAPASSVSNCCRLRSSMGSSPEPAVPA
jgi:hypothetical protein